jgi:hypothetical protein
MCFQCGCTTKGTSKEGQGESFSGPKSDIVETEVQE